ncbi:DUF563 domain containing protein [Nitzschia inconspicua]|uniref:EGF domain-specific O-linked N-acetylglucosamine transferase n=1 Tax=Nitzschia inconspicua TaxID=303405 RepID=A0A9K3PNL8_9STRA|nr:DUF563 domain containing protein [Nitzschia inconspicua]
MKLVREKKRSAVAFMWHRQKSSRPSSRTSVGSISTATTQLSPRYHLRQSSFCNARCIGRLFLISWGICVAAFGFILVQHHQKELQNGFYGQNKNVLPGLRPSNSMGSKNKEPYSSSFDSMSNIGIQQQGYAWMQAHKHATEDMFKLPQQLLGGESRPAAGVTPQNNNGQGDSPQSSYFRSFGGLPEWMGKKNHELAIGDTKYSLESDLAKEMLQPQCTNFDHSIKRPQHGCEVNEDTLIVFCNFDQLRIDVSKIDMDRGGEALETVMGREESAEFPKYQRGAFTLATKPDYQVPVPLRSNLHYLENVLNAVRYPTEKNKGKLNLSCDQTYPGVTLFITRYEYVNLYHTLTDWWSAYFVMPNDFTERPHRVVFLDGHAQGGLDDVWRVLFGEYHFVKYLPEGKGLCFEKAVFIPAGYKSPLYPDFDRNRCPNRAMATAFSDFVLTRYNLNWVEPIKGNVVIVDRQPYVSHPRSDTSKFQRKSSNFKELQSRLEKINGVTTQLVRLETHSFAEQLKLIRQAHVLIGHHGAALSHLMFMDRIKSHVIEFTSDYNDFFHYLSEWHGIDHEMINVGYLGTLEADQLKSVVDLVLGFMAS